MIMESNHIPYIDVNSSLIKPPMNNGYSQVFLSLTEVEGFSLTYIPTDDIDINLETGRAKISLTRPFYYVYPKDAERIKMDAVDLAISFNDARSRYLEQMNASVDADYAHD